MTTINTKRTLHYAITQALFWAAFCGSVNYASYFLQERGFSSSDVGMVLALANIGAIIVQAVIANYADKYRISQAKIMRYLTGIALVFLTLLYFVPNNFILTFLFFTVMAIIVFSFQPFLTALASNTENDINFSLARGCGSLGFTLTSLAIGRLTNIFNSDIVLTLSIIFFILFFISVTTYRQGTVATSSSKESTSYITLFKNDPSLLWVMIACTLMVTSHMFINAFLYVILQRVGGDSSNLGVAMAIMASVEIPLLFLYSKISRRVKTSTLLEISAVFFIIKIILHLIAPSVTFIYLAQITQILSYALFLPSSVEYVNKISDPKDVNKAQSCLGISQCLAGVLSSYFGGLLIDSVGLSMALIVATLCSVVGFIIIHFCKNKNI